MSPPRQEPFAVLALGIAAALLLAPSSSAQVFERGSVLPPADVEQLDSAGAAHLESARRFLTEQQWDEAVESIRRVQEASGEKLVKVELALPLAGFERYVPAAEYCQWRLGALAQESLTALEHYRRLVDPLAETWYREAVTIRDEALLRRVVERAFASRWGDDAMLRLGDLALERGDHAAARAIWQRISAELTVSGPLVRHLKAPSGSPLWLALRKFDFAGHRGEIPALFQDDAAAPLGCYPDSDLKQGDVRARLALASILEGSLERARVEVEILRALDSDAEGTIAGKSGKYVDLLDTLLQDAETWPLPKIADDWRTFAGNRERSKMAARPIDIAGRPLWSFPLPKLNSDRELVGAGRLRTADDGKALLGYHPVVVGQTVLVRCDARQRSYVVALDLASGSELWRVDYRRGIQRPAEARLAPLPDVPVDASFEISDSHADLSRHVGVARHTATVYGQQAYFRMGSPVTLPNATRRDRLLSKDQGFLLGLDLATQGKPLEGFPIRPESSAWSFEGSPIASGGLMYVAMRRSEGARSQLYVAAFERQTTATTVDDEDDDARPAGRLRWRTRVCSAATLKSGEIDELTHLLLTLSGNSLYLNTNCGAVAALSPDDGRLQWLVKYPRSSFRSGNPDLGEQQFFRDLVPCLKHKDLVILAPSDCDRIFALEGATGQIAWALPPGAAADAVHLLGVGHDTLLVSGDWLYWIDINTGRLLCQFPPAGPSGTGLAAPSPRGLGRGALAGDYVYYPTRESIYVFDQRPQQTDFGWQPKQIGEIQLIPRGVTGGNLVIAGGVMLIATGDRLVAFGE